MGSVVVDQRSARIIHPAMKQICLDFPDHACFQIVAA